MSSLATRTREWAAVQPTSESKPPGTGGSNLPRAVYHGNPPSGDRRPAPLAKIHPPVVPSRRRKRRSSVVSGSGSGMDSDCGRLSPSANRRAGFQNDTAQPAMHWIGIQPRMPEQGDRDRRRGVRKGKAEHSSACVTGASMTMLASFFPDQEPYLTGLAEQAARSRIVAGRTRAPETCRSSLRELVVAYVWN